VAAVQAHDPHAPEAVVVDGRPPAAVLVPLYEHEGEATLVLTRRSWHLRSHRGEVCFPGGRQDPGDPDLVSTALREAHEEVALDPAGVEIVGELDRLTTVSSPALIVPIVARLPARPHLVPAEVEVDAVLHLPLRELLDPSIYREEIWPLRPSRSINFFELEGDTLWGATALMLRNMLSLVAVAVASAGPPAASVDAQ
jgi:8-oxo-dGTP pyrophosphatase MutT (NUDIX family)